MRQISLLCAACCLGWTLTMQAQSTGNAGETVYVSPQGNDRTGKG